LITHIIYSAFQGRFGFLKLLITLFAFITAPVSANLMAQAAIHLRLRSTSGDVPEALNRPLPWIVIVVNRRRKSTLDSNSEPPKELKFNIIKMPRRWHFYIIDHCSESSSFLCSGKILTAFQSDQTYSYHRHWFYHNGNANAV
jgi:hypothetical protein